MNTITKRLSLLLIATVLLLASASAYTAWPGDEGTDISQKLHAGYEPSGAVWHEELSILLIVGDDGDVTRMNADGSNTITYTPGGDLEGITIADERVYVLVEHPDTIKEFSLETGRFTGKQWTLTSWLQGPNNYGAEAITWLPEEQLFAVGLQNDGKIYLFDVNRESSEDLTFKGTIEPRADGKRLSNDISGLHYDAGTQTLFALYDNKNLLIEMQNNKGWETVASYDLKGKNQEGIAINPNNGELWIAEDSGDLIHYKQFPFHFADSDGDGLSDREESILGTDSYNTDSDNDRLSDYEEVRTHKTNPLAKDTDGDTLADWKEVLKHGTDPLDPYSRGPEVVIDFEVNENEISITYASGRTYTIEPFGENKIEVAWVNKWNRAIKMTDGNIVRIIRNGEVSREWTPRNPTKYLKRMKALHN